VLDLCAVAHVAPMDPDLESAVAGLEGTPA